MYREGEVFLCPPFCPLYHLLCAVCEEGQVQTVQPAFSDIFSSSCIQTASNTQNNQPRIFEKTVKYKVSSKVDLSPYSAVSEMGHKLQQ